MAQVKFYGVTILEDELEAAIDCKGWSHVMKRYSRYNAGQNFNVCLVAIQAQNKKDATEQIINALGVKRWRGWSAFHEVLTPEVLEAEREREALAAAHKRQTRRAS